MQLNLTTDYAIRTVLFMASTKGGLVTSVQIADTINVSSNYIFKIMRQLVNSGIVKQFRGAQGGYQLLKDPKDITLWEIIELMEPKSKINRCLEDDHYCNINGTATCLVHKTYLYFQEQMENYFNSVSIQDILDGDIESKVHKFHCEEPKK